MVLLFTILSLLFPRAEATLVFAGDAMQHQVQLDNARRSNGIYDYDDAFSRIAPWVREADYAVVNLETTLGQNNFTGYPCFCSPDTYAAALKDAGFDLFLTANNHTLDRRDRGLRRTYAVLDSLGVDHIGTYPNAAERRQQLPLVKDINGFKVAFLNYTYGTNGIKIQGDAVVDYIDRRTIAADVRNARRAGAEIVVAMPHWGNEYQLTEHPSQRDLAQYMLDQGVDIIIGGHPHVLQPMHTYTDPTDSLARRVVVYSLGNFISGMRTRDTRGGALARVKLVRGADGKARVKSADYRLVFTLPGSAGQRGHSLIFVDADTDVSGDAGAWKGQCLDFTNAALRIFDKHNTDFPRYTPER